MTCQLRYAIKFHVLLIIQVMGMIAMFHIHCSRINGYGLAINSYKRHCFIGQTLVKIKTHYVK